MTPIKGTAPNAWTIRQLAKLKLRINFAVTLPFYFGIKFKKLTKKVIVSPTTCKLVFEWKWDK